MVEATPKQPYGGFTSDLHMVEKNMRKRCGGGTGREPLPAPR